MLPFAASQQTDLHVTLVALVLGLALGVFGHITRARWLILVGIVIIGLVSAYFSFVLQPGSG